MADALAVDRVMAKRNGTYYVLNQRSLRDQGVVTVKHTHRNTLVCLTDSVAEGLGQEWDNERHPGCAHTHAVHEHLDREGEPDVGETWTYRTENGARVRSVTPTPLLPRA